MNANHTILSDQKLYHLCKLYGEQAKKWRYKFMGLLPEVNRRRLFEKKGFQSIFEFAKKLAGLSEEQVRTVLNLEKRFDDKPILKKLLVEGEVSVNKLVRVQSIVTKENEEFWANQTKILSKSALETLVRDEKSLQQKEMGAQELKNKNDLQEPFFEGKSLPGQTQKESKSELKFSDEVEQKLLELQQKGIDVNQLILEMLQKRELEIAQAKEAISTQQTETISRYIPAHIKKLIQKEYGTKCSVKTCSKPAEQIHHTQRFALTHTHDPRYLAPLCKGHHLIAHSIDQKYQQKRMAPR